jgi:hypothetical protein
MAPRFLSVFLLAAFAAGSASADDLRARFLLASRAEMDARFSTAEGGGGGEVRHPSRRKAFLLSLLVPGLGQRANGEEFRSKIFLGAEAAIWTGVIVFKIQEANRTDDFEEYARAYAGVSSGEKETEFYRMLTIYDNVDDYNEAVRIEARQIYPVGEYPEEVRDAYFEANGYGPDRYFRWRTNADRLDYRLIRNDALDSGRRADYMLVAAVLNRAISAVEAARFAGRWGALSRGADHLRASASGAGEPPLLRLAVQARF